MGNFDKKRLRGRVRLQLFATPWGPTGWRTTPEFFAREALCPQEFQRRRDPRGKKQVEFTAQFTRT
jgi:hypothetical protein